MRVAGIGPASLQNPVHRFDSGGRLFDPSRVRKGQEGHVPGAYSAPSQPGVSG
jgi:hypothetical protein